MDCMETFRHHIYHPMRCEESGRRCMAGGASQMGPPPPPCSVDVYIWDGSQLKRVACASVGLA